MIKHEKLEDRAVRWRSEFEDLGEAKVRESIALNNFGSHHKFSIAKEWVQEREDRRLAEAASAASQREEKSLTLAEDANRLAEAANEKAETANTTAIAALLAAVISIIVSVVIAFTSTGN